MSKKFTVDARTILHLGRESIKDHTTALIELVKNSYDADATQVEIDIMCHADEPHIRIADNGHGMTEKDIDNHWLRIGYSQKIHNTVSPKGRRKTGEKGIGRISAARLGSVLELRTKTDDLESSIGLRINWDDFRFGIALSEIEIEEIYSPLVRFPQSASENGMQITMLPDSGTELIIKNFEPRNTKDNQQKWTKDDIDKLYRELSTLVSPFSNTEDCKFKLSTDVTDFYKTDIEPPEIFEVYEIRLQIEYDGTGDDIHCTWEERDITGVEGKRILSQSEYKWTDFIQRKIGDNSPKFGPFYADFMFYPDTKEVRKGTGFSRKDLREFLTRSAGIKIYRDNIKVKPYGDLTVPEGDWFGLGIKQGKNPAGAGREDFLIKPNQLVGAIFLSRDKNPEIVDSAGREGLIDGPALIALRDFTMGCVQLMSARHHQRTLERKELNATNKQEITRRSPSDEITELSKELEELQNKLTSIRSVLPLEASSEIDEAVVMIDDVGEQIGETKKSITELESQARIIRGLATIGISSTVFGHEAQTSIDALSGSLNLASKFLEVDPPKPERSLGSISDAQKYSEKIITWGNFALDRVRRDKRKRTKVDVKHVIEGVVEALRPAFSVVGITLTLKMESLVGHVFAMDIESIVINLLTNAYEACGQRQDNRQIRIELKQKTMSDIHGCEIIVADSGLGIAPEFVEIIWEPLYTTKTSKITNKRVNEGTGLGLPIIQSILDDLGGTRHVDTDSQLGGARFVIWIPVRKG